MAGLIGNPLSGWIMERFHLVGGHPGWQWLFVLEALPTIPLAIGVLLILSNRVQDATWLTQQQRDLITRDIAEDNAAANTCRCCGRCATRASGKSSP